MEIWRQWVCEPRSSERAVMNRVQTFHLSAAWLANKFESYRCLLKNNNNIVNVYLNLVY